MHVAASVAAIEARQALATPRHVRRCHWHNRKVVGEGGHGAQAPNYASPQKHNAPEHGASTTGSARLPRTSVGITETPINTSAWQQHVPPRGGSHPHENTLPQRHTDNPSKLLRKHTMPFPKRCLNRRTPQQNRAMASIPFSESIPMQPVLSSAITLPGCELYEAGLLKQVACNPSKLTHQVWGTGVMCDGLYGGTRPPPSASCERV